MAALNENTLQRTLALFRQGLTFQLVADALGSSRRMLFRWKARSARHDHNFFMIDAKSGAPGYWHNHVDRILYHENIYQIDPEFADATDDEIESLTGSKENRYLHDADGQRIKRADEPDEPLDDIAALEAAAREPPKHPRPDGPVQIMRASNPNDPPERRTNAPPELSTAEKERAHPRAYQSPNADLRPPASRPAWAKPAPKLDAATKGQGVNGEPPPEGRFTVATYTYSAAERRAGTVSFDGMGVRRW